MIYCPNVSAPIFEGTTKRDPLDIRIFEYLQYPHWGDPNFYLHDEVSLAGTFWVRTIEHNLGITDDVGDFYYESLSSNISFSDLAEVLRCRPYSIVDTIFFVDSHTKTGGCCALSPPVPATFNSNAFAGMVVYIVSDGVVDLAQANALPQADAVGVASIDVAATGTGYYLTEGRVTKGDWTAVAGTATLTPGAMYYLSKDTPGMITVTPPSASAGLGEHSVRIGRAITSSTLDIEIAQEVIL